MIEKQDIENLKIINNQIDEILSDVRHVWRLYSEAAQPDHHLLGIIQSALGFCHIRICAFTEELERYDLRPLKNCRTQISQLKTDKIKNTRHHFLAHPFRDKKGKSVLNLIDYSNYRFPTTIQEYEDLSGHINFIFEQIQKEEMQIKLMQ